MENKIVTAIFKDSTHTKVSDVWQYDYGQILRIQGLDLPTAVEVDFAVAGASESIARIGTTKDGVTDVVIPDSLIETGNNLVAYIYLRDAESGNTEYQIDMLVTKRAKPEAYDTPEDKELFGQAIEAVNTAADRAEKARQTAQEAAQKAGLDAEQTVQDRVEVAKMVETVTDISEQVKKVEELSDKAQESATQAGTSATAAEKAKAQAETAAGKTAEDRTAVNQAKIDVDEVQKAVRADRAAVEEVKQSVEQLSNAIPESAQVGVQAVNQAKQTAVDEIARTGISHKTAVEAAGTQAVESVENVQQVATEAVETAKTEAVQAVQTEGTTQTGNVTTEGTKQVKAVQDKGNEVLQSIPEDFQMQMESKLDKQQGVENKGKALVIGEDGNVAPGEVQSGGGDGIAIINTMSGESPLVIPDSAERVNKRLELGGKTEQVQTSGKQMLNEELLKSLSNYTSNGSDYYYYRISGLEVGKKYTISRGDVKTGKNALLGISVNQESTNKAKFLVHDGLGTSYNNASITWEQTTGEYVDILFSVSGSVTSTTQERLSEFWGRISYVQLEKGATATPYEPYTGGKPSPSSEYPQEIKNSGKWNEGTQKYEVDVKVTGKNLFDKDSVKKGYEFSSVASDMESPREGWFVSDFISVAEGKVYISGKSTGGGCKLYNKDKLFVKNIQATSGQLTIEEGISYFRLNGEVKDLNDIQVELGSAKTPYEPYRKLQTLTLTSDRPITKWDRLVEQGGQIGWLYKSKVYDGFDGKNNRIELGNKVGNVQHFSVYFASTPNSAGNANSYCDKYIGVNVSYTKEKFGIFCDWNNGVKFFSAPNEKVTNLEEFKAWLIENPLGLAYETLETEFVPLPQSEQNAIRALKTYYPTTVITADGGEVDPDIKVTYTADTKNYIDNKVSAKVASIIRQYRLNTANLLSLMPMETQAAMIENDTNNILENVEEMKHE